MNGPLFPVPLTSLSRRSYHRIFRKVFSTAVDQRWMLLCWIKWTSVKFLKASYERKYSQCEFLVQWESVMDLCCWINWRIIVEDWKLNSLRNVERTLEWSCKINRERKKKESAGISFEHGFVGRNGNTDFSSSQYEIPSMSSQWLLLSSSLVELRVTAVILGEGQVHVSTCFFASWSSVLKEVEGKAFMFALFWCCKL